MLSTLRQRLNARDESGFTLIELLVVLIIIGVLLAIAVPSYLGFKGRAQSTAASANVASAIPDAEAYYSDNGTYAGMTNAVLKSTYDSGLSGSLVVFGAATSYCLSSTVGTYTSKVVGPGGTIATGATACTSATG
jgi:type IV pilus assembly protein PilA